MKKEIILVGFGGHAKVICSVITQLDNYTILGYVDRRERKNNFGLKYLGSDEDLEVIYEQISKTAVLSLASVNVEDIKIRLGLYNKLKSIGFELETIISKTAVIDPSVSFGEGCFVADSVTINVDSSFGKCAIVNTASSVDHDSIIGDFVHIAPGATLCGQVTISKNSHIGAGATIINSINIVENVLIGAASVVTKDIKEKGTYVGVPARKK